MLLDPRRPAPGPAEPRRLPRRARGRRCAGPCAKRRRSPASRATDVIGIGVDTTGSTPIPVDAANRPLALDPRWRANLAAHAWLWKDHTGAAEAAAITADRRGPRAAVPRAHRRHATPPSGSGRRSGTASRWRPTCSTPRQLGGAGGLRAGRPGRRRRVRATIQRCVCAAGHKAMYSEAWGGLPSAEFLARLDPRLAELRERLFDQGVSRRPAGGAALRRVGGGAGPARRHPDRHGRVRRALRRGRRGRGGGHARQDHRHLHLRHAPSRRRASGSPTSPASAASCNGSIMPGYYGIEAGQSAVGDLLQVVGRARSCEGRRRAARARSRPRRRASRPGESGLARPRLEQRQPHHPRGPAAHRPHRRARRCTRRARRSIAR